MLTKYEGVVGSTKLPMSDRGNEILGELMAFMVSCGVATVTADNNPADGSGVYRTIDFTMPHSTRARRLTVSLNGTTGLKITYGHYTSSWQTIDNIWLGNTTTDNYVRVYADDYSNVVQMNDGFFASWKTVTSGCVLCSGGYWMIDAYPAVNHYAPSTLTSALKTDGISSLFIQPPGVMISSKWVTGDEYKSQQCVWTGADRFGTGAGQALEVATGQYLFSIAQGLYLGRLD